MQELAQDAAIYVDPNSIENIANSMSRLAADGHLRSRLIHAGIQKSKKYSWSKSAAQTYECFERVRKSLN